MCGRDYVTRLFAEHSASTDIAIIEGVMGLFDGSSPTSLEGSTAQIASWLQAPVALVVNSHGMGRSLAALVSGYAGFEPDIALAGVIANFCGSASHADLLARALQEANLPPLLGNVPRNALPALPDRHLGLVSAAETPWDEALIQHLATAAEKHLDLDHLLRQARNAPALPVLSPAPPVEMRADGRVRLAIARDAAFQFYYQDLFDALQKRGVEVLFFSPLEDKTLPADCAGLVLGGGYPEEHAERLCANHSMLNSIRDFCACGRPVYAECGGLMYLSQGLVEDGKTFPMLGILPAWTRMRTRRKRLGYMQVTLQKPTLFGASATRLRGHEFHYSELCTDPLQHPQWQAAYQVCANRDGVVHEEGYSRGRILASYVHLHLASNPEALNRFVSVLQKQPD
jgi:cobyrinic acid a,c-diamide synthase